MKKNPAQSLAVTLGLAMTTCFVFLAACLSPTFGGEAGELATGYSLLIGHPESSAAGGGSVLIVPGTLIPPLEGPGKLSDQLKQAYQLKAVNLNTQYNKQMTVNQAVEMPTTAPGVQIRVTLLGFNDSVATYRVELQHSGDTLADTPVSVKRGGRAVVGSRDGDAAPYLFVVIEADTVVPSTDKSPEMPKLIKRVQPSYPEEARKAGIKGTVVLRVLIDADGSCRVLEIVESPNPLLSDAARDAVNQWRYEPPRGATGKVLKEEFSVTVKFHLQ
jgi:TonB family protein